MPSRMPLAMWVSCQRRMQGNRVNFSGGDEAYEEGVVPCGDLAPQAHGIFGLGLSEQVVGHVPEGGEVGGSVLGADAAFVVAEGHVHDPVEAVFDRPVRADDRPE